MQSLGEIRDEILCFGGTFWYLFLNLAWAKMLTGIAGTFKWNLPWFRQFWGGFSCLNRHFSRYRGRSSQCLEDL